MSPPRSGWPQPRPFPHAAVLIAAWLAGCAPGPGPSVPPANPPRPAAPELWGAGLFSTGAWDFFVAFTPDQRCALFCRADDTFTRYQLLETRLDARGRWSPPVHPPFAAQWSNADPHVSPDGKRVYFVSNRPLPGEPQGAPAHASYDIWVAARMPDGSWGDAEHLPAPISDPEFDEYSPSVAANGDLYFGSNRRGGRGGYDLWVARWSAGAYQAPEALPEAINSPADEVEPWIAPDGSYLIFSALGRPDSQRYDLYSSRLIAGRWTPARRLPEPINSPAAEFNHSISPDGRWLYFSSTRPLTGPLGPRFDDPRNDAAIHGIGNARTGDIYRVPVTALGD